MPDKPVFIEDLDPSNIKTSEISILAEQIKSLLSQQSFCVLCTQGENQPYGSLIAFAFTDDLRHFFFTTPVTTRKYQLLSECPQVALVIDSRCQHRDDLTLVDAVTITGTASLIQSGADFNQGIAMLKKRHPYLVNLMESAFTALFRIDGVRYFYVTRFQEVSQWIP